MSRFYDRAGNPMSSAEWARAYQSARDADGAPNPNRHVGWEQVQDPDGRAFTVSTVWLGLDHNFGDGPPLIFETMVFAEGSPWNEWMDRYATEEEAAAGHAEVVKAIQRGDAP